MNLRSLGNLGNITLNSLNSLISLMERSDKPPPHRTDDAEREQSANEFALCRAARRKTEGQGGI